MNETKSNKTEKIAKRRYDIEQCKLWHKKITKKECKTCNCMECEYTKKEADQA